jgi:hypothetical protein
LVRWAESNELKKLLDDFEASVERNLKELIAKLDDVEARTELREILDDLLEERAKNQAPKRDS